MVFCGGCFSFSPELSVQPGDGAWDWQHPYNKKMVFKNLFVAEIISFLLPQLMHPVDLGLESQ